MRYPEILNQNVKYIYVASQKMHRETISDSCEIKHITYWNRRKQNCSQTIFQTLPHSGQKCEQKELISKGREKKAPFVTKNQRGEVTVTR